MKIIFETHLNVEMALLSGSLPQLVTWRLANVWASDVFPEAGGPAMTRRLVSCKSPTKSLRHDAGIPELKANNATLPIVAPTDFWCPFCSKKLRNEIKKTIF